ncbi:hypothetical protein [Lentzea pudingi]|uniref:hypothetical protein n=1 Tax=Lentzea pudingi TaxID=1789439 RepID=UPI0016664FA7|nr:hypothetical protein [Lentzea pudingi]
MTSDPHQFDHSVRDGIFDGSADDVHDLDHGYRGFQPFPHSSGRSGYHDVSGAPVWVKVLLWTGALLAIAGMGVLFLGFVTSFDGPDPSTTRLTPAFPTADLPPDFPVEALPPEFQTPTVRAFPTQGQHPAPSVGGPNLGLGFGLFFAGFLLSAIAALGHSTSTRR